MKKLFLVITILSASLSLHAQCVLDYANLSLDFEDQFNGTTLNNQIWETRDNDVLCSWQDVMYKNSPATVFVQNGKLHLKAIRQNPKLPIPQGVCPTQNEIGYISGAVKTNWPKYYNSGYFEVRCKMPAGVGTFPAFWLWGGGGDEIDIFEFGGEKPKQIANGVIDWPYPNGPARSLCGNYIEPLLCNDLTKDWHTYGMAWTKDHIIFFFDGKESWRKSTNFFEKLNQEYETINGELVPYRIPLILNLSMGEWGYNSTSEATFEIDYVKVYNIINKNIPVTKEATHEIALDPNPFELSNYPKSLAIGQNNTVFYRDNNDRVGTAYFDNSWQKSYLTSNWNDPSEIVGGDITVNYNDEVYFRGTDGKIHQYIYIYNPAPGHDWHHTIIGPNSTDLNTRVSNSPASIAASCGTIFYRGADNLIQVLFRNNNSWSHNWLTSWQNPQDELVDGDIGIGDGNIVFYRGKDRRMHMYYYDFTTNKWIHSWLPDNLDTNKEVSSIAGSIWVSPNNGNEVYYKTKNNWIATFYYKNGWQHSYLTNTWNSSELATGNLTGVRDQVFYKALDNKIQKYSKTGNGGWNHTKLLIPVSNNLAAGDGNQLFYALRPTIVPTTKDYLRSTLWRNCENLTNSCNTHTLLETRFASSDNANEEGTGSDMGFSAEADNMEPATLYPNPTTGLVNLNWSSSDSDISVTLYNTTGHKVSQFLFDSSPAQISLEELPIGLYFINVSSNSFQRTIKLIKH